MRNNPLIDYPGLPPFPAVRPEHAEPALDTLLAENRAGIAQLLQRLTATPTWDELTLPLAQMEDRLDRLWSPIRHLHSVADSPALREAYNRCLPKLSDYGTEIGQNRALFEAFEALARTDLDPVQTKIVSDALREFRLSGVALDGEKRARFKLLENELAQIKAGFEQNLLDATQAWHKEFSDPAALRGLPESALAAAQHRAQSHDKAGYEISLESPDYVAVMTYADDRALRREIHEAYQTRASDRGPQAGQFDNSEIMERILALRHEKAQLLGFSNFAELSLAAKMAKSPAEVIGFLEELARKARPYALREIQELERFAAAHLGLTQLESWDLAYVSEKLKQQRYALAREDLKPYLPVERVLSGLFSLVQRLYGVRVEAEEGAPSWHPDVRFYRLSEENGQVRGQFYLDLYAREHKRGGAWMDECQGRWRGPQGLRTPIAYLTCNAAPPAPGKPALFAHDEVVTLFHEFGHGLHHLLTQVDHPQVSGIRGVEWDAVELPSQFMENWCWQDEVLDLMARHHLSGERLPAEMKHKLLASRNFNAGLATLRQIEFSLFDFRMHLEYAPEHGGQIQKILDDVRRAVAVVSPPEYVRFQHSFAHIFAGGYGAGYYSYKWAEVLSADAFALFEEQGLFAGDAGRRFLHNVLEKGGSRPAMDLYQAFRQRKPSVDALLRHSGLAA